MRIWHEFILAAGFLTRLAPARVADEQALGRSIRLFAFVGLYLGTVMALPFIFGLATGHPWLQAWAWLGLSMALTRGLHWDGWVDLCDAWGSGVRGERFWEILKDSRMGAFGAMGLFMGMAGFLILLPEVVQRQEWGVLVWAPVLGRCAAVTLAWRIRPLARPGLAAIFLKAATGRPSALVAGTTLILGIVLVPSGVLLLSGMLCGGGVLFLSRLAHRQAGGNGDFLGAAVIWGELSVFLGWTLRGL